MFVSILLVELGALLIYAGIKGKSIPRLITGDNQTPAALPQGNITKQTVQGTGGTSG